MFQTGQRRPVADFIRRRIKNALADIDEDFWSSCKIKGRCIKKKYMIVRIGYINLFKLKLLW